MLKTRHYLLTDFFYFVGTSYFNFCALQLLRGANGAADWWDNAPGLPWPWCEQAIALTCHWRPESPVQVLSYQCRNIPEVRCVDACISNHLCVIFYMVCLVLPVALSQTHTLLLNLILPSTSPLISLAFHSASKLLNNFNNTCSSMIDKITPFKTRKM